MRCRSCRFTANCPLETMAFIMIRAPNAGYSSNPAATTESSSFKRPSIPCREPNLIKPYSAIKSVRFSIFQESLRRVRTTIGYTRVTLEQINPCAGHGAVNSPSIHWTAQKCRDIQVVQMRFAFGTIGAFVAGSISGYGSAFFHRLAGNQASVLLFKRLVKIDVEWSDRHGVNRGGRLRCSGWRRSRTRGLRGLFDQDWLRLQGEGAPVPETLASPDASLGLGPAPPPCATRRAE